MRKHQTNPNEPAFYKMLRTPFKTVKVVGTGGEEAAWPELQSGIPGGGLEIAKGQLRKNRQNLMALV